MGKFQITPISNLIENLTENIAPADVELSFGQIMLKTNMGQSLLDIGKNFISSDSSPLGKKQKKMLDVFILFFSQQWWADILYHLVSR